MTRGYLPALQPREVPDRVRRDNGWYYWDQRVNALDDQPQLVIGCTVNRPHDPKYPRYHSVTFGYRDPRTLEFKVTRRWRICLN